MKIKIFFLIFLAFSLTTFSQSEQRRLLMKKYLLKKYLVEGINEAKLSFDDKTLLDTTLIKIKNAQDDTVKLKWIEHIVEESWNDEVWPLYNQLMFEIADSNLIKNPNSSLYLRYKGAALNNFGYLETEKQDLVSSLKLYNEALEIAISLDNKSDIGSIYNNIGVIYSRIGDYNKTYEYYKEALKYKLLTKDITVVGTVYSNLASLTMKMRDTLNAENYYLKALESRLEENNTHRLASLYIFLGEFYITINAIEKAEQYLNLSKNICIKNDYKREYQEVLTAFASIYYSEEKYDSAFINLDKSLKILESIDYEYDKRKIFTLYSKLYTKLEKYDQAEKYAMLCYEKSIKSGEIENISSDALLLSSIYELKNNFKNALIYHKKFLEAEDKINSDEVRNAIAREQLNGFYKEKEQKLLIEEEKKIAIANEKSKNQRVVIYLVSITLIIVIIILIILYRRFKIAQEQKALISKQKALLDFKNDELNLKNKQVTDSILYSKHILNAVIPNEDVLKKELNDYFVFYNPKDIVSGDFYWVYNIDSENILIMVADCTGHGVPGAILSIVCTHTLENIVERNEIFDPAKILYEFNLDLAHRLKKNDLNQDQIKDGVELSICLYNKKENNIKFASAGHKLLVVSNNESHEYKGDIIPLGELKYSLNKKFSLTEIKLNVGDVFYLFSDGIADQKGGEKGKKLYYKPFYEFLTAISQLPCEVQKEKLSEFIIDWKRGIEQYDDMLVVGIKV